MDARSVHRTTMLTIHLLLHPSTAALTISPYPQGAYDPKRPCVGGLSVGFGAVGGNTTGRQDSVANTVGPGLTCAGLGMTNVPQGGRGWCSRLLDNFFPEKRGRESSSRLRKKKLPCAVHKKPNPSHLFVKTSQVKSSKTITHNKHQT